MFTPGETYERTRHAKVLMAANASGFVPDGLHEIINTLIDHAWRSDDKAVMRDLKNLLPEFQPPRYSQTGYTPPLLPPAKALTTKPLSLESVMNN